jgi:hypothetical protein
MQRVWYVVLGIAGGIVIGVLIASDGSPSQPSRSSSPAPTATIGSSRSPRPPLVTATRTAAVAEPEVPATSIEIPIPSRLGGAKPVSTATAAVAERLGLVPTELVDLAEGGELSTTVLQQLDNAHARGAELGERLGLEASERELLAARFAHQLVRIERELRQSPGARRDDVVEMVTRDTLEDLRRNVGDDVARAAESGVRGLKSLGAQ